MCVGSVGCCGGAGTKETLGGGAETQGRTELSARCQSADCRQGDREADVVRVEMVRAVDGTRECQGEVRGGGGERRGGGWVVRGEADGAAGCA